MEVQAVYTANDVRNASSFEKARAMIIANFNNPVTSRLWLKRGLLALYNRQNESERLSEQTIEHNKVGFSSFDASLLTSYSKQVLEFEAGHSRFKSPLSANQWMVLRLRMEKYAMQLARIARSK